MSSSKKEAGYNVPIDLWETRLSVHEFVRNIKGASSLEEASKYWNEANALLSIEDLNFVKSQCPLQLLEVLRSSNNIIAAEHRRLFS